MTLPAENHEYRETKLRTKRRAKIVAHAMEGQNCLDALLETMRNANDLVRIGTERLHTEEAVEGAKLNDKLCEAIGKLKADLEVLSRVWDADYITQAENEQMKKRAEDVPRKSQSKGQPKEREKATQAAS